MTRLGEGSRSLGLRTKVLPHAIASGNIHIGTMAGKLNGVMPATTPNGCRTDQASIPRATCSVNSPLSKLGIPVANSIISIPRTTSPTASGKVLPCSATMRRAISSRCDCARSRKRNITLARASGGKADHAGKAAEAAATAVSRSSTLPKRRWPWTAPVAGLRISVLESPWPAVACPLIQWVTT